MLFLEWLASREHVLHPCCARDLEQRDLNLGTRAAVQALGETWTSVRRCILQELLHRALYLHRYAMKHAHVLHHDTHASITTKATDVQLGIELSENLRTCMGWTLEQLADREWLGAPWPKMVALRKGDDEVLVDRAMELHLAISTRMAAHMQLSFENTSRTQWLAGSLLSTDAKVAQEGANVLHEHLLRVEPSARTKFEEALVSDAEVMPALERFKEHTPACLLWRGRGRFQQK